MKFFQSLKLNVLFFMLILFVFYGVVPTAFCKSGKDDVKVILLDEFDKLKSGHFFSVVGAHTEYHYLKESQPQGNWEISTFRSVDSQRGWRVIEENGSNVMQQAVTSKKGTHIHPMLVAGDSLWGNYTATVEFKPQSNESQSGLVFRYHNDRCYYFFGVIGDEAVLKMVKHATAFHKPYEKILAKADCKWTPGQYLTAKVTVTGSHITAFLSNGVKLEADDTTYPHGKIALLSDVPTIFKSVTVTTGAKEYKKLKKSIAKREDKLARLQAANPKPVLWKKIDTDGFGMGRNLRFGDLDGDGQIDVLIGQVKHHGPKDRNTELSCLTAITLDGKKLWQIGEPDPWKTDLTSDVGFQVHDLDGDGSNEVIYCMGMELIVADGATGKTKFKTKTPVMPKDEKRVHARFPHILGDALYFCDFRGTGHDSDIVIKTRYTNLWALNDKLETLWHAKCNTGHYPYAYDVDGDGKDELSIGYSLIDDDGKFIWSLDDKVKDHADGVAIVDYKKDSKLMLMCAASDEGMFFADMDGDIVKHHYIGHVQNPAVANFRSDLPGLETVSINFWGNQGIMHFYNSDGEIYHDFEPCAHGSMCLPVNWTGKDEEFFVLSANVEQGGLFDGFGRRVVKFPSDGHPDLAYAVMDITGDCRDEIVVWDPHELWVYTQSDGPRKGKLYKPIRNPQYNSSNYQATVSLEGWSQ